MLIDSKQRDHLCRQLTHIRGASINLERELLLDRATPLQAALRAYGLRDQINDLEDTLTQLLDRATN